ncbi:glycosyltransferase family 2 protein [Methanocorpusculum sp. GPch4]|uniref:glycosyltransferase family 2 protein n=1 Tax=Methanocorpusculum sp. GPch4 TaxID=2527877 RepID=UPI0014334112|nr:glycosyltransferase family 2 protein [Methanocorpusculum sp. GPch4]
MTPPRISIIVPLYNKVNEVQRAIDSIFAQTIQNFELIIVDGGSTDGSLDVIKKYESDSRYHLIHQLSKGLPAGRNEGIAAAGADLIAFLDADDEWLPTYIEQILKLNADYPSAGLYATAYIPTYGNQTQKLPLCEIPKKPWNGILDSYFRSTALAMQPPFSPCCVTIPKSTYDRVGLFNPSLNIGEDTEMWGRIALCLPIAYSSTEGAKYHWISNNKMTNIRMPIDHHPFYKYILSLPEQEEVINNTDGLQLYLEMEELNMAYINLIAGNKQYVKENLKIVQSKYFLKRKLLLELLLYLPSQIVKKIPLIKQKTLDRIRIWMSG